MTRWKAAGLCAILSTGLVAAACNPQRTPQATPTPSTAATAQATLGQSTPEVSQTPDEEPRDRFGYGWKTDFSRHSVPLREIEYLGLSRIPINPADAPEYESVEKASQRLSDLEPVIAVEVGGQARAYPLSMLIFVATEVANDTLGGAPIAVTW